MEKEAMNTEIEVTTEVSEGTDVDQGITTEESSGPSKGFIATVVGCGAALIIGVGVAIHNYRKNKRLNEEVMEEDDDFDDFHDEDLDVEETGDVEVKEVQVGEESPVKKTSKKK